MIREVFVEGRDGHRARLDRGEREGWGVRLPATVADDPAFGEALLREGIDAMLAGDVDAGKAVLRDYIKATIGFEKLGEATGT